MYFIYSFIKILNTILIELPMEYKIPIELPTD
jgi:hypothetical protein